MELDYYGLLCVGLIIIIPPGIFVPFYYFLHVISLKMFGLYKTRTRRDLKNTGYKELFFRFLNQRYIYIYSGDVDCSVEFERKTTRHLSIYLVPRPSRGSCVGSRMVSETVACGELVGILLQGLTAAARIYTGRYLIYGDIMDAGCRSQVVEKLKGFARRRCFRQT